MASWSSVQQLFTFWHQESLRVSCCTCALSARLIVAWRVEGKAQGFFLEATQRTDPRNLNLCLALHVLPAQGGAVWSVSMKDGAAEQEWQWVELCCACGRHFQSRWNYCRSLCQRGIGSTAGDICRERPVLPGGGCGSLEAIVANRIDAPQGQLKRCKWLCLLSFSAILIALVTWRVSCAKEKWDARIFLEALKFTQQLWAWSSRYRDVSFWRENQNSW